MAGRATPIGMTVAALAFALVILVRGPGDSAQPRPVPTGPPSAQLARAAIDWMFEEGFHFVETDISDSGTRGRIEEGDWIPPRTFHRRINWSTAENYATDPNRNRPMTESCRTSNNHKGDWKELVDGQFGQYQTLILLEIYRNDIRVIGESYEGFIYDDPVRFEVEGGHVTQLRDTSSSSSGYDYVYSNFGLPEPVDCRQ